MKTLAAKKEVFSRLSCRVSTRIKEQAEIAASLLGQSITDFTEAALADKSQAVLEQHERIRLSERDFQAFAVAIEAPAPPTPELRSAVTEYGRQQAEHPEANL
jgi:uncharacterized protein (DUF1778 family)